MNKKVITGVIVLLILASIIYYGIVLVLEYNSNLVLKESYENKDFNKMYNFFVLNNPLISDRTYLGGKSSPVTLMVVVDFESDTSKKFYYEKIPRIKELYIDSGQAKLYHKYYITPEEFDTKKGRFIYASAVQCYLGLGGEEIVEFHKTLFETAEKDILALTNSFVISREDFEECMNKNINNNPYKVIYEDMLETKMFKIQGPSIHIGIDGRDNTVLFGNPSISLINRSIRQKQIRLGI
ncbi:hypothetical protein AYK26_01750 [Euryarchaeota archaeon SM23-78]|nr:MAG: hypothetical protein AYK26_01750 [Euryarchaeota archaeon SM23-78]MBW3000850.1 hypothetical protein [Candidatus Woesearchaeota archaeon]